MYPSDRQSSTVATLENLSEQHRRMEINNTDSLQNLRSDLIASLKESTTEIKSRARETLSNLIQEGERSAAEQSVLKSLKYESMRTRHANIEEAHGYTFDWIFEDASSSPFPQVKFLEWLQTHSGFYWVAGKAGSGKSTLMKYLYKQSRTNKALQVWAGTKKLVTASYFFWIGGKEIQKSQDGLLCSLLDDILTKCPALIPAVASSRWQSSIQGVSNTYPWTRFELL